MTKQVTKTAAPKVAAKPAARAATRPAPVKETVKTIHILTDIARPVSGPRLFAHTIAAMQVLGMFGADRPAVLRSALQSMIGATAIRYHAKTKGNLLEQGDRIRLTEPGVGFFKSRGVNPDEARGFEKMFKTGDGSDVKVRKEHIVPVSVAL